MIHLDVVTFFASLGTIHSLFFSILLWFRQKNRLSNRLLAAFFFVTSIRIAKNIVVHIRVMDPHFPISNEMWRLGVNVGLIHQLAIGPLFFLYFKSLLQKEFSLKPRHLLHFTPYLALLPFSGVLAWPFWSDGGLYASYAHILIYYLMAFTLWRRSRHDRSNEEMIKKIKWLRLLLLLAGILMLIYSPALFKYTGYIGGALLYALGVYVISVGLLKDQRTQQKRKYETSALTDIASKKLQIRLLNTMEVEKIYLDPELSLTKLAEKLNISPTYLSQVINQHFQTSYADFVNTYRLQEAKNKLAQPQNAIYSISSLAFDSGFNSLSTFNTLFKKENQMTPSQYRAKFMKE
ncbi:MAG: helix-turn-helix domain-containing protein [Saprospiraceae bacterium]